MLFLYIYIYKTYMSYFCKEHFLVRDTILLVYGCILTKMGACVYVYVNFILTAKSTYYINFKVYNQGHYKKY